MTQEMNEQKRAKMEEWLKRFLGSQEPFCTSKQKQDAVKAFLEFEDLDERELYQNLEKLKEVCRRIDYYVSQAVPTVNQDRTLSLEGFLSKLLDFIVDLALLSEDIHGLLRDETSILTTLTSFLKDQYQIRDQAKILKTIEGLTRGIVVSWSAPYLKFLVKQVFYTLLSPRSLRENCLYGLRIITNLVFNNRNCLNMVLKEPTYKLVLKHVIGLLSDGAGDNELKTLALNFCFLTDQAISVQVSTQINNITNTFGEIQRTIEPEGFKDVRSVEATIYYVTLCVSTILTRCFNSQEESTPAIQDNRDKDRHAVKSMVQEISGVVFTRFFTKLFPLLRTDKGQIILISLFNLMKSLCPNYIPVEDYDNLWEGFAKSLNELSMVSCSHSRAQITVLEVHLHFVDRILKSKNKNALSAESFMWALNNCQIIVSSHPIDLSRNILTLRLLNRLNALAGMQSRNEGSSAAANKVSKLLSEESLSMLLFELLSENTDDYQSSAACLSMSTCVVEILNVIAKLSKNTTAALMESLEKEKTWFHISNCIVNGDEELISQALALIGVVGFSSKCRTGVSKTLVEMKALFTSSKSVPASPERPAFPSATATMGMKKLNDALELFQENHAKLLQGNDQTIDDVLAWYKLKTDMHEMELSNMNDHIFHLNRTITHLKTLLDKQSELVAKRAISSTTMKQEYADLQIQLKATKERKEELDIKHVKAVESLRHQLSYQEELYKKKCSNLVLLEKELSELKETCAQLQTTRDEAVEGMRQVSSEKRKLQEKLEETEREYKTSRQRLATAEVELKKSEEARKTTEALLEAERRKTEIIQQVLGRSS